MNIAELKKLVDKAYKKAGGAKGSAQVEFWLGEDQMLAIERIGQFGVVPDLVFSLKKGNKV